MSLLLKKRKSILFPGGFTLIEVIAYFFIFSIVVLSTGAILFNVISGKTKLETIHEVNQNGRLIIEQINQSIRSATSITTPVAGSSGQVLQLVMADAAQNPTQIDVSSGSIRIKKGTGAALALNTSEVTVPTILFTNVTYPGTPGAVRAAVTVSSVNTNNRREYGYTATFYSTVTIRPQ